MQKRITNARGIRLRGHGYGTTRCISFGHHELDLLDTWEELADQTFLSNSGVFKRFLRTESRKLKEKEMLADTLHGVTL